MDSFSGLDGGGACALYDQDFYAWTQMQAKFLRTQQWEHLDVEHLVEEIEALGRAERRELVSRLAVLVAHLLKWQYQPGQRSRSWLDTIEEQRERLAELCEDSPSLKFYLPQAADRAWKSALRLAVRETALLREAFPLCNPYNLEQVLDAAFLPHSGGSPDNG